MSVLTGRLLLGTPRGVAHSRASQANPLPVRPGVPLGMPRMAKPRTVRLCRRMRTTEHVDLPGHGLKVFRIHTRAIPAKVIKLLIGRDWADVMHVGKAVRSDLLALVMNNPIAVEAKWWSPYPATRRGHVISRVKALRGRGSRVIACWHLVSIPDCRHFAKALQDCLAALRFIENDQCVADLQVRKWRGEEPGLLVRIETMEGY